MSNPTDRLPIPELCDNCCSVNIEFVPNSVIYGEPQGEWPYAYLCHDCGASVACHFETRVPMGRLADKTTRRLRSKAHQEFDQIWKSGLMTRDKAYAWLAIQIGLDVSQTHISWLSKDQLKDVITLSSNFFNNNFAIMARRKEKQNARKQKFEEREQRAETRKQDQQARHRSKRHRKP